MNKFTIAAMVLVNVFFLVKVVQFSSWFLKARRLWADGFSFYAIYACVMVPYSAFVICSIKVIIKVWYR